MLRLDEKCKKVINMLEASGYEAFAVGGMVRDTLMSKAATDYDITTIALPQEIKAVFKGFAVIETGIRHGTVTVIVDKTPFEITTYRKENGYNDNRHPDNVEFVTDIEEDLSRRDFTINAIAFSEIKGMVDPYCGVEDIKNRVIRAVGDPEKRFSEDSLRIIRALRFAATLGFEIEKDTESAIFALSETLLNVSPERLFEELKKLVVGDYAKEVINKYKLALSTVFEVNDDVSRLENLPKEHSMRLAYLCKDVEKTLNFLKTDNETKRLAILLSKSAPIPKDVYRIKTQIAKYGRDDYQKISTYRRAVFGEDESRQTERILKEKCLSVSELTLDGNDLKSLGFKGKAIGFVLNRLLDSVLKGEIENEKELLLSKAKDIDI